MRRTLRILAHSSRLICPACHHGRMYRSFFKMNVRCPICGVIFERDSGEMTGGIAISTTLAMGITVLGSSLVFFDIPPLLLILGLAVFNIVFPFLFYRHARALWVGILYLTGSMFED